jgi:hypothetical protein
MRRLILRGLAAAVAGAAIGAAGLTFAHARLPQLTFEFDRDPPLVSGFFPVERAGDESFAWTSARAAISVPGLDRRAAWQCAIRMRGARPDGLPQPSVTMAIDGVIVQRQTATPDYSDIPIPVPPRQGRTGLDVAFAVDAPFIPSASDRRELGVQVDRLACEPSGEVRPPTPALMRAAAATAMFAAGFAVIGFSLFGCVLAAVLLSVWQSIALATGAAAYTPFVTEAFWLAATTTVVLIGLVKLIEMRLGRPLHASARFVMAFSTAVAYLKLLALLHPSKLIIDALFHARRLDWVLDGQLYFTQTMPNGVAFPYAIGLYLVAAPWSVLTDDHIGLLRIVVTGAETVAGALLYLLIARLWGDRLVAALAVVLFQLVPVAYIVIGNANQTNAFGQSAALVTIACATMWPLGQSQYRYLAGLTLLALLAFLSHVSTVSLLAATLLAMVGLYWWRGGPALRTPARSVLAATTMAAVLAGVLYYGHFGDAYRTLARVRSEAAVAGATPADAAVPTPAPVRVARALTITARDMGWPILALAAIGAFRLRTARRDPLTLMLGAMTIAYVIFTAFGAIVPVSAGFERQAAEFLSRVNLATYPGAVIAAAYGAAWMLRDGLAARLAAIALIGLGVAAASREWYSWIS